MVSADNVFYEGKTGDWGWLDRKLLGAVLDEDKRREKSDMVISKDNCTQNTWNVPNTQ